MKTTSSGSVDTDVRNNRFARLPIDELSDTANDIDEQIVPPSPPLVPKRKKKKTFPTTPVVSSEDAKLPRSSPERILQSLGRSRRTGLQELHRWTARDRRQEVDEDMAEELTTMYRPDAINVINELRRGVQWIRSIRGNSVMVPCTVESLHDGRGHTVSALLDSGATGCYVDRDFAERNALDIERLPRPVPVYNADGTTVEQLIMHTVGRHPGPMH